MSPPLATAALTLGALACFAANSLLARAALGHGLSDPWSFTVVRLASGAAALALLLEEPVTGRLVLSAAAILAGIALSLRAPLRRGR